MVLLKSARNSVLLGADEKEHASLQYCCHGVFVDCFKFRSNCLQIRPPWEYHDHSLETNWRHCVTGPELPFLLKRKGILKISSILKIDQSVKMPWQRLSMGIACSYLSAPGSLLQITHFLFEDEGLILFLTGYPCAMLSLPHWWSFAAWQIYIVLFSGGGGGGGGLRDNYSRPTQMRGFWDAPKSKDDSRSVSCW